MVFLSEDLALLSIICVGGDTGSTSIHGLLVVTDNVFCPGRLYPRALKRLRLRVRG